MDSRPELPLAKEQCACLLRSATEAWIDGCAPLLKQPFRDIASIPILLTPGAELSGRGIHFWRELQFLDPQFESMSESGTEQKKTSSPNAVSRDGSLQSCFRPSDRTENQRDAILCLVERCYGPVGPESPLMRSLTLLDNSASSITKNKPPRPFWLLLQVPEIAPC